MLLPSLILEFIPGEAASFPFFPDVINMALALLSMTLEWPLPGHCIRHIVTVKGYAGSHLMVDGND